LPRARHRLDLLLIPTDPELELPRSDWEALRAAWEDRGLLQDDRPGTAAEQLIQGGFGRCWIDHPGGTHLFANQQGGYRVGCPSCATWITGAFVGALTSWRSGGERRMGCPRCEESVLLESLVFRPPAGFARWALVLSDVISLEPEPSLLGEAEAALGPLKFVLQRVG
jgi:hypothetical protein